MDLNQGELVQLLIIAKDRPSIWSPTSEWKAWRKNLIHRKVIPQESETKNHLKNLEIKTIYFKWELFIPWGNN